MTTYLYKHINLDYLNLMTDGDDDMKKIMLDMLFEELPQELEKMMALHNAGDYEELKSVSHKMKSTLSFIGNDTMTEANKMIEATIKNGGGTAKIGQSLQQLMDNQPIVIAELRAEYDRL